MAEITDPKENPVMPDRYEDKSATPVSPLPQPSTKGKGKGAENDGVIPRKNTWTYDKDEWHPAENAAAATDYRSTFVVAYHPPLYVSAITYAIVVVVVVSLLLLGRWAL